MADKFLNQQPAPRQGRQFAVISLQSKPPLVSSIQAKYVRPNGDNDKSEKKYPGSNELTKKK
jgi:hypothetical protein